MLVECQNCGAPLKADGTEAFVDCQYCGRTNKVASSKTLMAHVPVDWKPPAQWTPQMRDQVVKGAVASTSSTGIELRMNKRAVLVNSQIIAGEVGVDAHQNADVTIEGGRIEGSPVAVRTDRNGELVNHGAELVDRP